MKNPLIIFAMLLAASCLSLFEAEELEQKQQPRTSQQQSPPQPSPPQPLPRADSFFYQDVSWSPDGSGLKRVSEQPAFFAPLSPDGRSLALVGGHYPANGVYVMRADGSELKRLTP